MADPFRGLYEMGYAIVDRLASLMDSVAYAGAFVLVAAVAALLGYVVADILFSHVHVAQGEVLAKERMPSFAGRPVLFGFAGGFGAVRTPDRHLVSVRTPHGDLTFEASKRLFESLAIGNEAIVRYRQGRYSGRVRPERVLV